MTVENADSGRVSSLSQQNVDGAITPNQPQTRNTSDLEGKSADDVAFRSINLKNLPAAKASR